MFLMGCRPIESNMELTMQLYFRTYWQDPRLNVSWEKVPESVKSQTIPAKYYDELPWHPDPFFVGATDIQSPALLTEPLLIKVHRDKSIMVSKLIMLTVPCFHDYRYFPLDVAVCELNIESCE